MPALRFIGSVAALALAAPAVAAQAASAAIPVGFYSPSVSAVTAGTSATVNLNVIDGGRKVDDIGLQCDTPSSQTLDGFPPGTQLVVEDTGPIAIKHRAFSYSGPVTLGPKETGNGSTVTTTLTIEGKFKAGTIKRRKGTALSGTISSALCDPSTVASYALLWSSKKPAPAATARRPAA